MLLKRTIYLFFFIGLLLYAFLIPYSPDTISYYNFINVVVFITNAMLLLWSMGRDESFYTYSRLGINVFLYSLTFVFLYLDVSFHYTENSFFWDYTDPYQYYGMDVKFIDNEVPFLEQPTWLEKNWNWGPSDWGASMTQTLFLQIIPSRYFLFFMQTAIGAIGATMMFGIGKKIMRIDYAYLAALTYSISSFSLYYYASFRKEIFMVLIVIASFWCFYQFLSSHNKIYVWLCGLITAIMFFFRPEVIGLMLVGIASYYISKKINKKNVPFIILLLLMVIGLAFSVIVSLLSSFSNDMANNENYVDTSTFGIIVSTVGVLVGPFPQMLQVGQSDMSQLPLYGSGLLLKYIFFLAFWNGVFVAVKKQEQEVFPLFVFTIMEMLALAVMNDGLELRKAMPHISIFYIVAFWFINKYDNCVLEEERMFGLYPLKKVKPDIMLIGLAMFVFFSTFVWNTMRH